MPHRQLNPLVLFVHLAIVPGCSPLSHVDLEEWELVSDQSPSRLSLPGTVWDQVGEQPTYTLRTTAEVPPALRGEELELSIPYWPTVAELRVNGHLVEPTRDWEPSYRWGLPHRWRIPPDATASPTLDLELRAQNQWFRSTEIPTVPRLLEVSRSDPRADLAWASLLPLALFAAGVMFATAFAYLMLFTVDRRKRAFFWLALQVSTIVVYPLFLSGLTSLLFGRYDLPVLAFSLATAVVVGIYSTHHRFDLGPVPRTWILYWVFMGIFPLLVLGRPMEPYRWLMWATVAGAASAAPYQLWRLGQLLRRPSPPRGARIHFVAWVLLGLAMLPDFFAWLGWWEPLFGVRVAPLGLMVFCLIEFITISREHLFLNSSLSDRVRELDARKVEMEHLNQELRRQIEERSTQLAEVLARLASGTGHAPTLDAGAQVDGRYRIVRRIGAGAMGEVYEVERLSDDRRLALKILAGAPSALGYARLAREAQVASRIHHPNVVGILDVSVASAGFMYLVLEYVDGPSLDSVETPVPPGTLLSILGDVAAGLTALHAEGIVHRDLKPANVLLSEDERGATLAKITDFGVSRPGVQSLEDSVATTPSYVPPPAVELSSEPSSHRTAHDTEDDDMSGETAMLDTRSSSSDGGDPGWVALTQVGRVMGTPRYMAPELIEGPDRASTAADVFAFGVLAYELVRGRHPFDRAPIHGGERIPSERFSAVCSSWPSEVAELLERCLEPNPTARPSAASLKAALDLAPPSEMAIRA